MNIYFGCTSVYNMFMASFISEYMYKSTEAHKVLYLLEHVDNLMRLQDRVLKTGLFDEVRIIRTKNMSNNDIIHQFDNIPFEKNDVFHFFGFCRESFAFYWATPNFVKIIMTDEGIATLNIKESVLRFYHSELYDDRAFVYNRIDEVWLCSPSLSENSLDAIEKEIPIKTILREKESREHIKKEMAFLFDIGDFQIPQKSIIFFDQYLGQNNDIFPDAEQYLLSELEVATHGYNLIVKKHPGEQNINKYMHITATQMKYNYAPWEALLLFDESLFDGKPTPRVFITYNSSAAFNQITMFNDRFSHVIFLNKIVNNYTDKDIDDGIIEYIGEKKFNYNVYYPETFSELSEDLYQINIKFLEDDAIKKNLGWFERHKQKKAIKKQHIQLGILQREESIRKNNWLMSFYHKFYKALPSPYNKTTLSFRTHGEEFGGEIENPIYIENEYLKLTESFKVGDDYRNKCDIIECQWYVVRGRRVSIKVEDIICKTSTGDVKIQKDKWSHYGRVLDNGTIEYIGFDPFIYFSIPGDTEQVQITWTMSFDNKYISFLNSANEMAADLVDRMNKIKI